MEEAAALERRKNAESKSPTKRREAPLGEKDDKPKKKKPEMKDAQTQTERSDYARIKKQQ